MNGGLDKEKKQSEDWQMTAYFWRVVVVCSRTFEDGSGVHGVPCVGVRGGDAVQVSLRSGLSPSVGELRRGVLVFGR